VSGRLHLSEISSDIFTRRRKKEDLNKSDAAGSEAGLLEENVERKGASR
jgi:hypothetical protein